MGLLLLTLATTAAPVKVEEEGKLKIFPSDNELVLRNFDDGTYKWVYEKDGMFRAEVEGEDGVVKGVYTLSDQEGNVETQAYISGGKQGGHRLVEFGELGIDLPPKAGQRKFPAAKHAEEKGEMEEEEEENVVDKQSHPVQIQPFGSYKKEIEAVVIEAEQEKINDGAVGALAGPPVFRRPQMDSNIYHYNTNYNLIYQYPRQLQYENPAESFYLPVYNRPRQYNYPFFPWYRK